MQRARLGLAVLLFVCALFSGISLYKWYKREQRLCSPEEISSIVTSPDLSPEACSLVKKVVNTPLFFLGKGRQSIAYESADGRYVVKVLRHSKKKRKQPRFTETVQGALLAWKEIPEETGILVCAFSARKSDPLPKMTVLSEKEGVQTVDLNQCAFIVQRRASSFKRVMLQLACAKRWDEARLYIDALIRLLEKCREKGVVDRDGALVRNGDLGIIGKSVILIDTGKLIRCSDRRRQTLHDVHRLKPLVTWLRSASPELSAYCCAALKKYHESA